MSASSLKERLKFMGIGPTEIALLRELKPLVETELPGVLEAFYEELARWPQMSALFRDKRHIQHARDAQLAHWLLIVEGRLDESYLESVRRIGLAHARIGLSPQWYLGGYSHIISGIQSALVDKLGDAAPFTKKRNIARTKAMLAVFQKVTLIDIDYAIAVYLEALEERAASERAQREAEEARVNAEQTQLVEALGVGLGHMSQGDLTFELRDAVPPRFAKLRDDFNAAIVRYCSGQNGLLHGASPYRNARSAASSGGQRGSRGFIPA
ncbi:MAG: hypothetical protein KJS97_13430, partial [Alphaproteobacteria bacterium]|nr:hypothetical protein [Alphaproteobacteria bacterium]